MPAGVQAWLEERGTGDAAEAWAKTWDEVSGRFEELTEVDADLARGIAAWVREGNVEGAEMTLKAEEEGRTPAQVSRLRLARADLALLRGDVPEAVGLFRGAVEVFGDEEMADQARVRHLAAARLYNHGLQHGGAGTPEAVEFYRLNAAMFDVSRQPGAHALTQTGLGHALRSLGAAREGEAGVTLLAEAAQAYRAALETATGEDLAVTNRNLGLTLWQQAERVDDARSAELLAESVAAYRAAAGDARRVAAPVDWAMTQSNLGLALMEQAARSGPAGAGYLEESIAAYRGALDVLNAPEHPVGHATVQGNLGRALQSLAETAEGEEARERLTAAVSAFRSALALRSRTAQPGPWAATQLNLATALERLGDSEEAGRAAEHYDEALVAYGAVLEVFSHGTAHDHARAAIERLKSKRAA